MKNKILSIVCLVSLLLFTVRRFFLIVLYRNPLDVNRDVNLDFWIPLISELFVLMSAVFLLLEIMQVQCFKLWRNAWLPFFFVGYLMKALFYKSFILALFLP